MSRRYSKDPEVDRSLRHSVKDGVAYSVMTGAGESYFAAFALFFKATTAQIGLLASLPPLLASFAQLVSAWLGRRRGRRKDIIMLGAGVQALALLPILVLPLLFPDLAIELLLVFAVIYFAGANLAAPQWCSLMGDLVPERRRGRFFARRTRLSSITAFLALVFAGVALDIYDRNDYTVAGYVTLFVVAALARLVSVYHLSRMHDTPGHVAALESPFQHGLWRRIIGSPFGRFSLSYAAMQFAVAIASPFFIVYMLRDLQYSYLEYTVNIAASVLVQFLTLNRWGRISDAFGNRVILVVTGAVIPFLPVLWLVSTNYVYLLFVQALSGLVWAGFSLSASNYLYDLTPPEKRATLLALHGVGVGLAVFIGAAIGGYLGTHLPERAVIMEVEYHWLSALYGVFVISTLVRLTVALALLPRLREVRAVRRLTVGGLIFRVARLHPLSGMAFDVIGAIRRRDDSSPR